MLTKSELIEQLQTGVYEVTFTKVNGDNRVMPCTLMADHLPEFGTKFTTYLYSGVYIECLKELKFKEKSNRCNKKLHDNISRDNGDILKIDLMDEVLTREEFDLLSDKISNMTINEMAAVRDYSRETVRKKLKKISRRIKDKFN